MKKSDYLKSRNERLGALALSFSGKPYDTGLIPLDVKVNGPKFTVVCPDHGPWVVSYSSFRSSGCPKCGILRLRTTKKKNPTASVPRLTLKELKAKVRARFPQVEFLRTPLTEEKAARNQWTVRCATHGLTVTKSLHSLAWDGSVKSLCPSCASEVARSKATLIKKSADGLEALKTSASALGYKLVRYRGSHEPVDLHCSKHGPFQIKRAYYVTQLMSGCPVCRKASSLAEQLVAGQLQDLGRLERNRRDLLGDSGLELDLYYPEHKVAVEVNGVFYHGGDRYQVSHAKKYDLARNQGIHLLQFTDMEVVHKLDLVTSMIRAKCGLFRTRGYAKELRVDLNVPSKEATAFLNEHHIQGALGATFRIGLRGPKGGLVQLATFGPARFNKKARWELLRLATHKDVQVVGGSARLLSAFRKSHPGSIVSYADCRYSLGTVYERTGFSFVGRTAANYTYLKGGRTVKRYQAQASKLADPRCTLLTKPYDPNLSEWGNMKASGWMRVFDAGNLVYLIE